MILSVGKSEDNAKRRASEVHELWLISVATVGLDAQCKVLNNTTFSYLEFKFC